MDKLWSGLDIDNRYLGECPLLHKKLSEQIDGLSNQIQGAFYGIDKIDGYRRLFSITDTSLRYPYADPDRIPVSEILLSDSNATLLLIS